MGSESPGKSPSKWNFPGLPADLVTVLILTVATVIAVAIPVLRGTLIQPVLTLVYVLFVPGWTLLAVLRPGAAGNDVSGVSGRDITRNGLTTAKRLWLSLLISVAIIPLVTALFILISLSTTSVPIVFSLALITFIAVVVAFYRRGTLPPEQQFSLPWHRWVRQSRSVLFSSETRADLTLTVVFIVALLVSFGAVGYAVTAPQQRDTFTEFYLLSENNAGELIADEYPQNLTLNESSQLVVGVSNHEHQTVSYRIRVELQRVRVRNNSTRVLKTDLLRQFELTLANNETWKKQHRVSPTMVGDRLRLRYLLYRNDQETGNAYRKLHLWVNVSSK